MGEMNRVSVQDLFPVCRLEKAFKSGTVKLNSVCRQEKMREDIIAALINLDRSPCTGPAPPGFMEDELEMWVAAFADDEI